MGDSSGVVEKSVRSVFVGNIPYEATEERLKEIFSQVGPVLSFKLMYDRESGKPKGYGFCEYKDQETALSAMRNLNSFEISGRPLRVDNACTEKSRMEMQSLMMGPVVESPYGPEVEPSKAPEAISNAVASLPPEQMYELMRQMKLCVRNNPAEARTMLLNNPQLAYALLQAQVVMRIIDPKVAVQILHGQTNHSELIAPLLPKTNAPTGVPPPMNGNMPPQRYPPPQMMGPPTSGPPPGAFNQPPMPVPPPRPQNHGPPFKGNSEFDNRPMGGPGMPPGPNHMPHMGGPPPPHTAPPPPNVSNFGPPRDRDNRPSDRDIRDEREFRDNRRPYGNDSDFRPGGPPANPPTSMNSAPPRNAPPPPSIPNLPPGLAGQDQEKASLIMQVLQLSDEQIRMLPPEQQASILQLKEQIQRSQGR